MVGKDTAIWRAVDFPCHPDERSDERVPAKRVLRCARGDIQGSNATQSLRACSSNDPKRGSSRSGAQVAGVAMVGLDHVEQLVRALAA